MAELEDDENNCEGLLEFYRNMRKTTFFNFDKANSKSRYGILLLSISKKIGLKR